jgi:hypothetical protein
MRQFTNAGKGVGCIDENLFKFRGSEVAVWIIEKNDGTIQ